MNCLIIEDEPHAAEYLESQLAAEEQHIEIVARLDTVESSVEWLKDHETDLIFMDIQLGDGLSFEIFDHVQVSTPIIFTTSYDRYVIRSFEQNNLAYLLKPVKQEELHVALAKYHQLYPARELLNTRIIPLNGQFQKRFLVKSGSVFRSVNIDDIAYFHLQNKRYLFIITKDRQQYLYDNTMEYVERRIDPARFFRVNRQYMIGFDSITQMHPQERGRLRIELDPEAKEEVIVSINKAAAFKDWLDQ